MANKIISYANEDEIYSKARADAPENDPEREQIIADLKAQMNGQPVGGVDGGGYAQVDLRPSWYKRFLSKNDYDISGPPTTSVGADIAGAVGSAATEGAQQNVNQLARMPGARADQVARLQAKANSRGMLTAGLGALLNKKSHDFDTQQKRAAVDSSTLNKRVKTGASINERLGYLNFDKTTKRNEELAQQKAIEEAKRIAEADKASPESIRSQVAAVGSGTVSPELANDLSKEELQKWRPAFQQTQAQEHGDQKFDRERDRLESEKLGDEERDDVRRQEAERREALNKRRENFIPGRAWANNTPPPPAVAAEARTLTSDRDEMMKGAERLAALQARLEEMNGMAAAVGQSVDAYIGDAESKQLLAEAKLIQAKMSTAARRMDNMGVPQQFELELQNSLNPVAGSIGAYFRGRAPWDAIKKYYDETGEAQLRVRGSFPSDDQSRPNEDPLAAPVEEGVRRYPRPPVRRANGSPPVTNVQVPVGAPAGTQSEFGVQPGDSLGGAQPVPPIPADARKAGTPSPVAGPQGDKPMGGMWIVNMPSGPTKPRPLTESQYKMLQQKFPGQVKQVQ
jgi:hypothetical protein